MDKLDAVLSILNRGDRHKALRDYAKAVGVNVNSAVDKSGELIEEKAAILIFDAAKVQAGRNSGNLKFLVVILAIATGVAVLTAFLPKIMRGLYEEESLNNLRMEKVLQGYDKHGKPVSAGEGEAVSFRPMNGKILDYHDNGVVKYELFYKDGILKRRREYNQSGRFVEERNFNIN